MAGFQDAADHALQIAFYLLVAHPQNPVAIFSQPPAAQPVPQDHFGGCHLLSQLPGALAGFVEAVYPWHNPISCLNYRADFQSKHNLFDGRPASLELGRGRAGVSEGELGFASLDPPSEGVIFRFDVCAEACGINFVQEPDAL
jgi:hypothetical protein